MIEIFKHLLMYRFFSVALLVAILLSDLVSGNPRMQNRGEQLNRQIDPLQFGSCRTNSLCCSGRDSRCSVLMPMSTQSIQRRSSRDSISLFGNLLETSNAPLKECYCDGACITLGDCCADYKETCGGNCIDWPSLID